MTSRTKWTFPVKAYSYAIDCMRAIQVRQELGQEMSAGWEKQYSYHAFVKALIERVDQEELEKGAKR